MTTPQHVKRMREDINGGVCNSVSCACPTCGVIDKLIQGALAGSHPVERFRVMVRPPIEEGSYPYRARVLVDGREVYRVYDQPTEVLEADVMADIKAALEVTRC